MRKVLVLCLTLFSVFCFGQPIGFQSAITGVSNPLQVTNAGDNSHRLFVLEQGGTIKVYAKDYSFLSNYLVVGDLGTDGEQGLLSMAFHPKYYQNGFVYVFYAATDRSLRVDRYTVSSSNVNMAEPTSKINIITISHANYTNHNGGQLNFGPDGYLYLSTGDGGGGGDPLEVSQNNASLLGKLIRINVDQPANGLNYSIPADNPYNNEIFCNGLRNPFRWSFDRLNSDVFIGDVGQNAKEEVSYSTFANLRAKNFGWDCYEGFGSYEQTGCNTETTTYTPPIYDYPISGSEASVIGGVVYRGYEFPDLQGVYFCIDFYSSNLRKIKYANGTWNVNIQDMGLANFTNFGESETGEVFVTRRVGGSSAVYKLIQLQTTAQKVYSFTGKGNFTNTANWYNGEVPPMATIGNATVVIKPLKGAECLLDQNVELNQIQNFIIENKASFKIKANLKF
jgi:glucose/arabinose dehydrogenase